MVAGQPIVIASQDPSSFGWSVAKNIVPYSYFGPGAIPIAGTPFIGGVAHGTEPIWNSVLSQLVPLIEGGLNSASCFGFANRDKVGASGKSFHAYGLALDINASSNGRGLPKGRSGRYVIPDDASAIASAHGCEWGGDWSYTDPMHIEIHMTPTEVAQFNGVDTLGATTTAPAATTGIKQILPLAGIAIIGGIIVFSQIGKK